MKERKSIFRRWWFWLIIILVIGGIGSTLTDDEETDTPKAVETAGKQEDKPKEDEPKEEDSKEEKTEFGVGEKAELKGNIIEVTKVEKSSGTDFDKPKDGKEYVIVHISIENGSDKEISYNPFDYKMQNSQGQIESQTFTTVDSDTSLSSGNLAAGGSVSGTVTFEQPIDDSELQLIFVENFFSDKEIRFNLQ